MTKFERRMSLGLGLFCLSLLPVGGGAFYSLRKVLTEQQRFITINAHEMILAERLRFINESQSARMPVFVISGSLDALNGYEQRHEDFEQTLNELMASETDLRARAYLDEIAFLERRLYNLTEPGVRLRLSGFSEESANAYFQREAGPVVMRLADRLNQVVANEEASFEGGRVNLERTTSSVITLLIFVVLLALGFLFFSGVLIVRVMRDKRIADHRDRALLEKERRLSRARKETVEVVAHDLKNPLAAIQMSVALITEEESFAGSPQEIRDGLQIVRRSADSMHRLIQDLLDHAKIESGQFVLRKNACEFHRVLESACASLWTLARAKGVELSLECEPGLLVECDGARIEQVLSNLIGNAIKFTPSSGRVSVKVWLNDDDLCVVVRDTGPGLSPEQIPHLFDRFWQARATAHQGTGLGLAIAKSIIEAHGGSIRVESEKGRGAEFHFLIPRWGASAAKTPILAGEPVDLTEII